MKTNELRQLSLDELKKRLVDEEENLANLRFQLSTQQLDSPVRVRTVRRDIARLKTLIRLEEGKTPVVADTKTPETTETNAS
jgi:large subunit ribosomal protein L29